MVFAEVLHRLELTCGPTEQASSGVLGEAHPNLASSDLNVRVCDGGRWDADCGARREPHNETVFPKDDMATAVGVESTQGGDCTPVGCVVHEILMRIRCDVPADVERTGRKDRPLGVQRQRRISPVQTADEPMVELVHLWGKGLHQV